MVCVTLLLVVAVLAAEFSPTNSSPSESFVTEFNRIGSGISDDWRALDPRLRGQRFQVEYGDSKLWVVGAYATSAESSSGQNQPLSKGGVVSSFDTAGRRWSHKLYENVQSNATAGTTFVMNKHLYMLSYSTEIGADPLRGIFVWKDESWKQCNWQTPQSNRSARIKCNRITTDWTDYHGYTLHIAATCRNERNTPVRIIYKVVQIPSSSSTSSTGGNSRQAEYAFQTEEMTVFNTPLENYILFAGSRGNKVTLFNSVESDSDTGLLRLNCSVAQLVNPKLSQVSVVEYAGCPGVIDNPKAYQILNNLIVFGRGQTNKIYMLNFSRKEWFEVRGPYNGQGEVAVDRMMKTVFTVSLTDGVRSSDLFVR